MISTENWWEKIFSGPLAIGINEEKIHQLEDETFLYFSEELPQSDNDFEADESMEN